MANDLTEDQIHNMSDDDLEAAVLEVRSNEGAVANEPAVEVKEDLVDVKEDSEQPDVDSDDDLPTEKTEDEKVDEELETEEETPDEEPLDDDDQTEKTETETEELVEKVINELDTFMSTKSIVKANGKEFEFSNKEKIEAFDRLYPQAMDYTKKTQAIKPWRKTIDALDTADLGHEDVSLMIDVLKGDKDAIAQVLKRTGTDTLDLDLEASKYQPKDYGRDDTALDVKDIIDSISSDKEYEITHKVISKEWDEASFNKMTNKPELISRLHTDVKSGMYDKIQPIADKAKIFAGVNSGKSDLDFYIEAAGQFNLEQVRIENRAKEEEQTKAQRVLEKNKAQEVSKVKANQVKTETTKRSAGKRKAAAPARTNAGTNKVIDYLDDSDEAFDEWYTKMQDSQ